MEGRVPGLEVGLREMESVLSLLLHNLLVSLGLGLQQWGPLGIPQTRSGGLSG